jgi:tripeptidyl-peptidase-1
MTLLLSNLPASNAVAIPTSQVHEARSSAPAGWTRGSRLSKKSTLPIRIALSQSNLDQLHDHLMRVSEPTSEEYGQHWTVEQVRKTFAPSETTRNAVTDWLVDAGIASHRLKHDVGSGGWIGFDATVEEAESLFQTKYFHWTHPKASNGVSFPAVEEFYSLPAHIRPHIDFVTPTLHFDMKLGKKSDTDFEKRDHLEKRIVGTLKIPLGSPDSPTVPKFVSPPDPFQVFFGNTSQCDQYITPACLRALYNIPTLPTILPPNPKNSYAVVEYTPQQYIPSDLTGFFANYSQNQKQLAPTLVSIDGGNINTPGAYGFGYNGESNLDLEYGMTLVNPIPTTLYQTGDANAGASFNNFLDAFDASFCAGDDPVQDSHYPDPGGYTGPETCGGYTPAKVISTSYGYNEPDLSPAYEMRQCQEYAKFGLLGTTFVYSSGDSGVAGGGNSCIDSDGYYNDGTSGQFVPSFPSTCPYILSVGATQIIPGSSVRAPESACQQVISSGGGFSNVFPTPSYQKSALATYFAKNTPPYTAAQYNNSMATRGFPDVSANGANYMTLIDGQYQLVYGTSASSPVFAAVLALINEARLNLGKASVGFVNPALYANPTMLNDITSGSNKGCGTQGFSAVAGWDPVTGLGTPNYLKMLTYFLLH